MRVAFLMNKPLREQKNFEKVINQITTIAPEAECLLMTLYDSETFIRLLSFAPDTIVLFPLTGINLPFIYYQLKILLRARLLTFRTEGTFHEESQCNIDSHSGKMIKYGPTLVDGEVFWGKAMQLVIGHNLFMQNKISSIDRLFSTGYPEYETFFEDTKILEKYHGYKKEDVILFLTGFYFARYTDENILAAKDLVDESAADASQKFESMRRVRDKYQILRQRWISAIQKVAQQNPHKLIIVKHHPIEYSNGIDDYYDQLHYFENVELASQNSVTNDLILASGVVVQYGSTCLAAAYLAKSYTVFAAADDLFDSEDEITGLVPHEVNGFTSHATIKLENIAKFLSTYQFDPEKTAIPPQIQIKLRETFNIIPGEDYCPSKNLAQLILDSKKAPYQNVILSKQDMMYFFEDAYTHKRYGLVNIYKTVFKNKKISFGLRLRYLKRYAMAILFGRYTVH